MFSMEEDARFIQDREDLISIIRMRFGEVPPEMIADIYTINDLDRLDRLILAAANASTFKIFQEEIGADHNSFRLVGERFNPIDSKKVGD